MWFSIYHSMHRASLIHVLMCGLLSHSFCSDSTIFCLLPCLVSRLALRITPADHTSAICVTCRVSRQSILYITMFQVLMILAVCGCALSFWKAKELDQGRFKQLNDIPPGRQIAIYDN